jgi:hypothetical protein
MFCPSCGTESTIELNYCNRCGANLSAPLIPSTEIAPINVTRPILIIGVVMLFLTLGGFAGVLSSAIEVATRPAGSKDLSIAITVFGMITILTIDILLFRLLSKLINAALGSHKVSAGHPAPQEPARFARPTTAKLQPAPPSVTENTTRFFDPYTAPRTADPLVPRKSK